MNTQEFKKIVKTAVREAIQEELKDILLEAIKPSGNTITEQKKTAPLKTPAPVNTPAGSSQADILNDLLLETARSGNWRGALNMSTEDISADAYSGVTDMGGLPAGEVPLDLILKMTSGGRG